MDRFARTAEKVGEDLEPARILHVRLDAREVEAPDVAGALHRRHAPGVRAQVSADPRRVEHGADRFGALQRVLEMSGGVVGAPRRAGEETGRLDDRPFGNHEADAPGVDPIGERKHGFVEVGGDRWIAEPCAGRPERVGHRSNPPPRGVATDLGELRAELVLAIEERIDSRQERQAVPGIDRTQHGAKVRLERAEAVRVVRRERDRRALTQQCQPWRLLVAAGEGSRGRERFARFVDATVVERRDVAEEDRRALMRRLLELSGDPGVRLGGRLRAGTVPELPAVERHAYETAREPDVIAECARDLGHLLIERQALGWVTEVPERGACRVQYRQPGRCVSRAPRKHDCLSRHRDGNQGFLGGLERGGQSREEPGAQRFLRRIDCRERLLEQPLELAVEHGEREMLPVRERSQGQVVRTVASACDRGGVTAHAASPPGVVGAHARAPEGEQQREPLGAVVAEDVEDRERSFEKRDRFLVGLDLQRALGSGSRVLDRLGDPDERRRFDRVPRQADRALPPIERHALFERAHERAMDGEPALFRQVCVEHVAEEDVREREVLGIGQLDDLRLDGGPERADDFGAREPARQTHDPHVRCASLDRGDLEDGARVGREERETPPHHVVHARRERARRPGRAEQSQRFHDDQWVAFGTGDESLRDVRSMTSAGHERSDCARAQARELDRVRIGADASEQRGAGRELRLGVAPRRDDGDGRPAEARCEEAEELERPVIGGVQILEHDRDRLRRSEPPQDAGGRVVEPESDLLRVGLRRQRWRSCLGEELRNLREVGSFEEREQLAYDLRPGPERRCAARLPGPAPRDPESPVLGARCERLGERGLPDPRLAGEHCERTPSRGRLVDRLGEVAELGVAIDERQIHCAYLPRGEPRHELAGKSTNCGSSGYALAMLLLVLACSRPVHPDRHSLPDESVPDAIEYVCEPVMQADGATASGVEYCAVEGGELGYVNRIAAEACAGDPRATVPPCHDPDEGKCAEDADCADEQVCGIATEGPYCRCYDVCASDADCGVDRACLCATQAISVNGGSGSHPLGAVDQCLPATCRTGADCASGECGAAPDVCGQGGSVIGLYCRTAEDECRSNDDCAQPTPVCSIDVTRSRWACFESATCE